jgi:hypothetical protein
MKKIAALLLTTIPLSANATNIDALIKSATNKNLSQNPQWLALLHYNGNKSVITDPDFFLDKNGRRDPDAELNATIRAIFEPFFKSYDMGREFKGGFTSTFRKGHAVCQYPARTEWLAKELGFAIPKYDCPDIDKFMKKMKGNKLTLIFAANTLKNPTSMFGHNLFRLDESGNEYGSQTINFAAITPDGRNPATFAINGFFGGYPGIYSFAPYYEKVQSYSVNDNRNLQEFQLDFSETQVAFLKKHLWEMAFTYIDYYFLDVNCSSAALDLVRVMNPNIPEYNEPTVFPVDIIRILKPHITNVNQRDSLQTKITKHWEQLNNTEQTAFRNFTKSADLETLPPESRARVVETLFDANQYYAANDKITKDGMRKRTFELIAMQRKNKTAAKWDTPTPIEPIYESHKTSSITFGATADNFGARGNITLTPAYHTMTDSDFAMNKWSEVKLMETSASFGDDGLHLDNFQLVNLISMNPDIAIFNPISWQFGLSLGEFRDVKKWDYNGWQFGANIAIGKSYEFGTDNIFYALGEINANTKTLSGGIKLGIAFQELNEWKNITELTGNIAIRKYSSVKLNNTFAYYFNTNRRINFELGAEYFYNLQKLSATTHLSLTQNF